MPDDAGREAFRLGLQAFFEDLGGAAGFSFKGARGFEGPVLLALT